MTAKKLQSLSTLSQLIRHPNLGPFILEHGHLCTPHLWGPSAAKPYEKLSRLFQEQWPSRPPLYVVGHHLPQADMEPIQACFGLNTPQWLDIPLPFERLNLQIARCITQHQKLQALLRILDDVPPDTSTATLVVCQAPKSIATLKERLTPRNVITLHRHLDSTEQEVQIRQLLEEPHPLILVESPMLAQLPFSLLAKTRLQIVHWQLPWSCETLAHQVLPACHPKTTTLESWILYSKEDYSAQKQALSRQLSESGPSKFIHRDHFNRVRHVCLQTGTCLRIFLENTMEGWQSTRTNCETCTVCTDPGNSSLWRNLLQLFLF